jgi:hypothetical protein
MVFSPDLGARCSALIPPAAAFSDRTNWAASVSAWLRLRETAKLSLRPYRKAGRIKIAPNANTLAVGGRNTGRTILMTNYHTNFTFTEPLIEVETDDPHLLGGPKKWALCQHLCPTMRELLSQGATIVAADTAWTQCELNIVLSRGPNFSSIKKLSSFGASLETWRCDDTHYAVEFGVSCNQCKHGLSWPQDNAYQI